MKKQIITALVLCSLLAACGETREEKLAEQHSKGAELVEDNAAMAKGVGDALKKDGKDAAQSITEGVGDVVKGVAQSVDKLEADYKIGLSDSAKANQLRVERVVTVPKDSEDRKGLKAYVISPKALKTHLQLRALDEKGVEIGRSHKVEAQFEGDDAAYIEFRFDSATPLTRVAQFVLYSA